MNIKIVDSWLREFLETKALSKDIAQELSLKSVSVEKTEKIEKDTVYDIEVTTNRVDLMSVTGIAREASVALSEEKSGAKFIKPKYPNVPSADISFPIDIKIDPKLVNRIMAVVLEVEIGQSLEKIKDRLEKSGIRSLNNVIDVTNYVMREIGHPTHVFDYDLLNTKNIIIRESKPGEVITTLDGKQYRLLGGDIVADNGEGEIVDLLGVMGTANSVVQENTKRILFFIDNNNPRNIRKTSMSLGIRTEAAIINEKGVDPQLMPDALKRGVELYMEFAKGKVVSKVLDLYPNKPKKIKIKLSEEKINRVIGTPIPLSKSSEILEKLGFSIKKSSSILEVEVPTIRIGDVSIPEDLVEEIARISGYHKLPSIISEFVSTKIVPYANSFYFEERVKNALKYWGYSETYTYSMVSEDLYQGPLENAVKIRNPLSDEMVYLRNSLVPSLLAVVNDNKSREVIKIFELGNTYFKKQNDLPLEKLMLGGVLKKPNASFYEIKGLIEALLEDLGVKNVKFKNRSEGAGADVLISGTVIGYVEVLNTNLLDFELEFEKLLSHASLKKTYKPLAKFPQVKEDITFVLDDGVNTEDVTEEIKLQSFLIREVTFKDQYKNSRTFHIIYQAEDKNLTTKEVSEIRDQIIKAVKEKFQGEVK